MYYFYQRRKLNIRDIHLPTTALLNTNARPWLTPGLERPKHCITL
jgi:hypothetical protein